MLGASLRALVLVAVIPLAPLAWGHHSTSAVFDTARRVTVTGTLTKVDWINPHIFIYVDETGSEPKSWTMEGSPPAWWRNVGVNRATFTSNLGQPITVTGMPARSGSNDLYMRKIVFASGETLESISTD